MHLAPRKFFIRRDGKNVSVSEAEFAAHQAAHPAPPPPRGLGDVVALFAEPIARASDALLGTHLVGCGSCAERRAALNKAVSFKR
jgi:hypothetical protein